MKNLTSKINHIGIILLLAVFTLGFKSAAVVDKITICHVPPGNPGNCHEITVSLNALDAHLDHGDDLVCHNEDELAVAQRIVRDRNLTMKPNGTTTNIIITFTP
jgi:hypothetical protein